MSTQPKAMPKKVRGSIFMELLRAADATPKLFVFDSKFDKDNAANSVRNLARNRGMNDVYVLARGREVFIWRAEMKPLKFKPSSVRIEDGGETEDKIDRMLQLASMKPRR